MRRTLLVALAALVAMEVTLHLFGERIGEPQFWYAPDAQQVIGEMDRLQEAGLTSDLVLAGSSMVRWGIRPPVLEDGLSSIMRANNAGLPKGYTTVTRRWLLEEVLPRLIPERVVWGLTSLDFNGGRPTPAIVEYEEARAGALGLFGSLDRQLWSVSMVARYRDLIRGPAFVLHLFDPVPERPPEIALEDLMQPVDWPELRQTQQGLLDLKSSLLADFHIGGRHAEDFAYTVETLGDSGVEVVIVLLPVSAEYVAAHPNGAEGFESFLDWIRSEGERLGVPMFDYSRAIPEEEFLDYNHVGPSGATMLTEMLLADLSGLGW